MRRQATHLAPMRRSAPIVAGGRRHTGAMVARRRRRWWWIAAAAVVLVAATALVLVRFVFLRDTATTVSPGDVLARYRASSTVAVTTTGGSGLTLPAPGVYRYATTGSERVDALGGATHTYPPITTITVTEAGCGVQTRWDALQERWNLRQLCLGHGGIVSG